MFWIVSGWLKYQYQAGMKILQKIQYQYQAGMKIFKRFNTSISQYVQKLIPAQHWLKVEPCYNGSQKL